LPGGEEGHLTSFEEWSGVISANFTSVFGVVSHQRGRSGLGAPPLTQKMWTNSKSA